MRERLEALSLDALLVAAPLNVRWLSGYTGSNALLLVEPGRARLFTDFRYATAVDALAGSWEIEMLDQNLVGALAGRLGELVPGRWASVARRVARQLGRLRAGADLVPTTMVVEGLRAVKDADEIDRLRPRAPPPTASTGDRRGRPRRPHREPGRPAHRGVRPRARRRAVLPAHRGHRRQRREAARRAPRRGDRGRHVRRHRPGRARRGLLRRLHAHFATGPVEDEGARVYDVVARAQTAAFALVKPGTPCIEVHETARRIIGEAGLRRLLPARHRARRRARHPRGAALPRRLRRGARAGQRRHRRAGRLPSRALRRPHRGPVVVTEDGCEVLTHHPKSLIEVG